MIARNAPLQRLISANILFIAYERGLNNMHLCSCFVLIGAYTEDMSRPLTAAADPRLLKGRGARSNESSRYDTEKRVRFDDGWNREDEEPPPLKTEIIRDSTRTIITRNNSPDISFDRSINPYRGCEHGCIYCFARPTHAYLGLSPGLDFESKLLVKPDAAKLLDAELRKPSYRVAVIAMGTNTDPYQPIERDLRITRSILEVLAAFKHPVGDRHQIGRDHPRHRHSGTDGGRGSRQGGAVDHDARPEARAQHGAARGHAGAAARNGSRACRCRHPGRGDGGADDPGAERRRDGSDPRRSGRGRRDAGGLHASAPAARDQGSVPRMARDPRARTRRSM